MKATRSFTNILRNQSGGVAVYAAIFSMLGIGAGALAIDIGRMTLLRAEMQNRADAGAMAGARYLDGRDGAQGRATEVATEAMQEYSNMSNGSELSVPAAGIDFYTTLDPLVAATSDLDSGFIRVTLEPRQMTVYFRRVLDILAGQTNATSTTLNATAVAGTQPFICNAPPLMICDFNDPAGSGPDLKDPDNIGRQVRLKEPQGGGSQAWAPGNYGLLAVNGSNAAGDAEAALAAVTPDACYAYLVQTNPGSMTNRVKKGINARFDLPANPWPYPAPNVINYPRDAVIIADSTATLGDGVWDLTTYWSARHGGALVPPELSSIAGTGEQATRYQTYLYELGETFLVQADSNEPGYGKATIHPTVATPPGYAAVGPNPTGADVPVDGANPDDPEYDGEPSQTVASDGPARRIVEVALLKCATHNVQGSGSYPTEGNYLEMFITEYVPNPPNAAIYGEVLRALTPLNSPEFYSNVMLVE